MPVPKVSIAMPVRNAAAYLPLSLGSIFAQTFSDWELLLFDDGSDDESLAILHRLPGSRIRIFYDKRNLGGAARRNQLISEARGEYIAYIDADDLMHPARIEMQLAFLDRYPDVSGVGCAMIVLDEGLRPVGVRKFPVTHAEICARPLRGISLAHPTFVSRTSWWKQRRYNEANRYCEDWELWSSAYESSQFANLVEPLYFYRQFSSFSLQREIAARLTISSLQWKRRARFGWIAAASACMAEYARCGVIATACTLGRKDWLFRRRSLPIDAKTAALYSSALPKIIHSATELFGKEAVPASLLEECGAGAGTNVNSSSPQASTA